MEAYAKSNGRLIWTSKTLRGRNGPDFGERRMENSFSRRWDTFVCVCMLRGVPDVSSGRSRQIAGPTTGLNFSKCEKSILCCFSTFGTEVACVGKTSSFGRIRASLHHSIAGGG